MSGLELWSARKKGNKLRTERSPKWEEELGSGEDDGGVREARKCGTTSFEEPVAGNALRSCLTLWGRFKRCGGFDATWDLFGVVGRSSFTRDNLQWARDVTRTRVETRRRLDEGPVG